MFGVPRLDNLNLVHFTLVLMRPVTISAGGDSLRRLSKRMVCVSGLGDDEKWRTNVTMPG